MALSPSPACPAGRHPLPPGEREQESGNSGVQYVGFGRHAFRDGIVSIPSSSGQLFEPVPIYSTRPGALSAIFLGLPSMPEDIRSASGTIYPFSSSASRAWISRSAAWRTTRASASVKAAWGS